MKMMMMITPTTPAKSKMAGHDYLSLMKRSEEDVEMEGWTGIEIGYFFSLPRHSV